MRKLSDSIKKISVVLTEKKFKEIERTAKAESKKVSQTIREGLDFWLKNKKKSEQKKNLK